LKNEILLKVSEIQNLKVDASGKEEIIKKLKNAMAENKHDAINRKNSQDKGEMSSESKFQEKVKDLVNKYENTISKLKSQIDKITESENFLFSESESVKNLNIEHTKSLNKFLAEKKDLLGEISKLKDTITELRSDNSK